MKDLPTIDNLISAANEVTRPSHGFPEKTILYRKNNKRVTLLVQRHEQLFIHSINI